LQHTPRARGPTHGSAGRPCSRSNRKPREASVRKRAGWLVALGIGIAAGFLPAAGQAAPAEALDRLGWLAGCWELRAGARTTTEMWMPPAGGMMIGGSRMVVAGVTREFEHLRLTARGDTVVYTALPSGQSETHFRSTSVSATEVAFENRAHDFPQVIRYRRVGNDSLVARIEGPGSDNTVRGIDFPMRRASCTGIPAGPAEHARVSTAGQP
jgi:hypothetical protein